MTKTCAAQDIGAVGVLLATVIATTEDAAGYRRAVTYFDGQLLPLLGLTSQKALANAREKCVQAGWIHYEHGRKGVAGRYWTTVPVHAKGLDQSPTDEGHDPVEEDATPMRIEKDVETATDPPSNGNETATIGLGKGRTNTPIAIAGTNTELLTAPATDLSWIEGESKEFLEWWDVLPMGMRQGQRAAWALWPKILIEIQAKIRCQESEAVVHLIQRTRLFANSPRGKTEEYRWSPTTFLKDGHYDDAVESWERTPNGRAKTGGRGSGQRPKHVESTENDELLSRAGIT